MQAEASEGKFAGLDHRFKLGLECARRLGCNLVLDRYMKPRLVLVLRGQHAVEQVRDLGPNGQHGGTGQCQGGALPQTHQTAQFALWRCIFPRHPREDRRQLLAQ